MSVNSRFKEKHSIGRKFQSPAVRGKKLLTQTCNLSYNHATYQNNEYTSLENKEMEPVDEYLMNIYQSHTQMNIYQSHTHRKNLSWLHFDNELRVQVRQQVKGKQSCISVFVAYLTIPSSNQEQQLRHGNSILCTGRMAILQRNRASPRERNFIEQIKGPIFLEVVLAIKTIKEPHSSLEEKIKRDFCSRTDPSIFTSIALVLFDWSNKTSRVSPALKSKCYFLHWSTMSRRSDSCCW